jgi:ERCC4-related helicase
MPYNCQYFLELPLNLRNYQNEWAQNAVDGKNTLICAPTNSGKTLVSVYVMRKRYYYALDKGENFKVKYINFYF